MIYIEISLFHEIHEYERHGFSGHMVDCQAQIQLQLLHRQDCVALMDRESYLAEHFRQITHYLAEHQLQKNDNLFNKKFLTFMHICKYASIQVCKYTIMHYASM